MSLTDPENPDERPQLFDEPILADSPEEATRICRQKAERDGTKLISVKEPSKVRRGLIQSYRCIFEGNSAE